MAEKIKKKKSISRKLLPIIIVLLIVLITVGIIWRKVTVDETFVDNVKAALQDMAIKLKLDRIPFLERFIKKRY